MKLHCPHCGVKGTADDSYAGRKVKCPKCQGIFEVLEDMASEPVDDASMAALDSSPSISSEPAVEELEISTPAAEVEEVEEADGKEYLTTALDEAELEPDEEPELDISVESEPDPEPDPEPEPEPEPEAEVTSESEDVLAWDDIASDIDLDTTEDEIGEEPEDTSKEGTAELQSLLEDSISADEDLPEQAEEILEEIEANDEVDEEILTLDEEERAEVEEFSPEESQLSESLDSEEIENKLEEDLAEYDESIELSQEDISEDEIQTLQEDDVELEPYGLDKEQCWQCGKEASDDEAFTDKDGRLYCGECNPAESLEETDGLSEEISVLAEEMAALGGQQDVERSSVVEEPELGDTATPKVTTEDVTPHFTIGGAIREAWARTKGAKGSIWAGSAIMYLIILVVVAGGAMLLPVMVGDSAGLNGVLANFLLGVINGVLSGIFTAGLLLMGIRKCKGADISWKMIFSGFSCAGKIVVASILQFILVFIGMIIFVLPGIYLAIGYVMTIPLIIDKKMSPWQAMETSRKAIHKVWWKVLGLFIVMSILFTISAIPIGIGIIWTWPMSIMLAGVVYHRLFSAGDKID